MNKATDRQFGDVVEIVRKSPTLVEFKYPGQDWTLFMARLAFDTLYRPVSK